MVQKLDDLDRKILSQLLEDGRVSVRTLAEKIDVHPNTLTQRLKKLEKHVIKNYSTNVDFTALEYDFHVAILMKEDGRPGDVEEFRDILDMDELEAFYSTTGEWDILSLWRVKDKDHLMDLLVKITNHPRITRTLTNNILITYQSPRKFNPLKKYLNKKTKEA